MSFYLTCRELFGDSKLPIAATSLANRPLVQSDPHRHQFYEILFIAGGTLLNQIETEDLSLTAGDLIVMKPFVQHLLKKRDAKNDVRAYCCSFLPQVVDSRILGIEDVALTDSADKYFFQPFLSLASEEVPAVMVKIPKQFIPTIEQSFVDLIKASSIDSEAYAARAKWHFLRLLATISDYHRHEEDRGGVGPTTITVAASRHRKDLLKALDYIHSHISETISLEDAAAMSDMSVSYFSVLIKQYTGMSFIHYLTSLRMDHACSLLRDTSQSIMDVSRQVGFNDYSNFSKRFKSVVGQSPRDYRKNNQAAEA